jgi:hypothetical protein
VVKGSNARRVGVPDHPVGKPLPVYKAMEEKLCLLLTVGILDNVFGPGVTSWDGLKNLRIPASIANTGRRMPLRNEMRDVSGR